jgi:hypothetical protein
VSVVLLRLTHGRRERLGTHEAIERADHPPQRAQAQRCSAVDRLHASLRDQLRPAIGAGRGPVRDGHAHGAGLVPIAKAGGPGERGVVAGQRPDAPGEPGDEQVPVLLENGEGIRSKELPEGLVSRRPGDSPPNESPKRTRVRDP